MDYSQRCSEADGGNKTGTHYNVIKLDFSDQFYKNARVPNLDFSRPAKIFPSPRVVSSAAMFECDPPHELGRAADDAARGLAQTPHRQLEVLRAGEHLGRDPVAGGLGRAADGGGAGQRPRHLGLGVYEGQLRPAPAPARVHAGEADPGAGGGAGAGQRLLGVEVHVLQRGYGIMVIMGCLLYGSLVNICPSERRVTGYTAHH